MVHHTRIAAFAAVVTLIGGCSEPPTNPVAKSPQPALRLTPVQAKGARRDDTPWRRMTDAELASKVADASGRVFIGFKDPGAGAGVDESGRVLVSRPNVAAAKAQLRALGLGFEIEFVDMPAVVTRIPPRLVAHLRANPLIEYVEPIFPGTYTAQTTTWNVSRVNAPAAWSLSTGAGAKLLIIDSGIDFTHPDLAPAVVQSCESPPTDGHDAVGHGTAVAGIAAAVNNNIQIVGVAHGVALWTSEIGAPNPDPGYAACAVQFGRVNHVGVINMSVSLVPYTALTDQINAAYNQDGIVIVAGAGNTYGGAVTYPATLDAAIAVSATDQNDNFGSFSAAGAKVELAAPGTTVTDQTGLTTTCVGGTSASSCGFGIVQGTSFSAPHVAAAAAILKAFNPTWTNVYIRSRLQLTAVDLGAAGRDNNFGYGLVNILAALNYHPTPLTVSVSGPTQIRPGATCTWDAVVSGGTPPYSYSWFNDNMFGGNGPEYTGSKDPGNLGDHFTIRVNVTDVGTSSGSASITVYEVASAPICRF